MFRTIFKNREEIKEKYRLEVYRSVQRKKQKVGVFDKLEKVLVEWLHQAPPLKLAISGLIICEKREKLVKTCKIALTLQMAG
ncbi:hypothetical protein WA026_009021 [Henosepilachna vigintioctopunctata]|uniref:Uncharacterized protein n=1 Tax=Henosepilachna vigintioctopunctata TaxID=420089 RepID=A0AAW1UWC2_9CUCU